MVGAPIIYHTWPKVAAVIPCLNKSTVQPVTQYFVNTSYSRKVAKQSDVGQEITFSPFINVLRLLHLTFYTHSCLRIFISFSIHQALTLIKVSMSGFTASYVLYLLRRKAKAVWHAAE